MKIEELEKLLESGRGSIGASSCIFYVQDPFWSDEYRLVCMPGVRYREPMHGFLFPDRSKRLISEGDPEIFCADATCVSTPEPDQLVLPDGIREEIRPLFQDFSRRESVKSFARLIRRSNDGTAYGILFVNFDHPVGFNEELKTEIRALFESAIAAIEEVTQNLRELDAAPLAEAIRILRPALAVAKPRDPQLSQSDELKDRFRAILRLALEALGLGVTDALGTIHLYDQQAHRLDLWAHYGDVRDIGSARNQSVKSGQGVISWCVLRRTAILIEDIPNSPYRNIWVSINNDVKSEMAVPMVADGQVLGVLNLESTRVGAFSPESVRSIWYAANSAAVAYQLSQQSATSRNLLEICWRATADREGARQSLNEIAKLLQKALLADFSDIWHFNAQLRRFDAAGASYEPFHPSIRTDGWSAYVRKTRDTIWISRIVSGESCSAAIWEANEWRDLTDASAAPGTANSRLRELGVRAELGMPITVGRECVGVAWIKYLQDRQPPSPDLVHEAKMLGGQAGLVLESIQHQLDLPDRDALERIGGQLKSNLFATGPLNLGELKAIDGYVIHRSLHPYAGGDFHCVRLINEVTAGVLLGDGEGHAVTGLLNALPIITTFEALRSESGATRHVMDRLMSVSNDLGVRGSALYSTFTLVQSALWLSVTSAGHKPLILLRRRPSLDIHIFPPSDSPALGGNLGYRLKLPLAEAQERLQPGDTLIACTDGLTDAFDLQPDEIPRELARLALEKTLGTSKLVAEAIFQAAEKASPWSDDATVMVFQVAE